MFSSLSPTILQQVLEYAIPYAVELHPEFADADIPIEAFSKHPMAFFYLVQRDMDVRILSNTMLSEQNNDEIVRYLLEHPDMIDFLSFCKNPHPKAVQYVLEKSKTKKEIEKEIEKNKDTETDVQHYANLPQNIRTSLSKNTHDDIVRYELVNVRSYQLPILEFAANPNDLIVTYLLEQPYYIYHWNQFSKNPNKRVIDYLLEHPDRIDWSNFARHDDDRVVTLFLELIRIKPEKFFYNCIDAACANPNNMMVEYLLRDPQRPTISTGTFFVNTNPMAIEWLLEHMDRYRESIFLSTKHPIYNHPDIRIFTKLLTMFPDPTYKVRMVQNPNVFYRHVDTRLQEWYLLQLTELSSSSYGRKKRIQTSRIRKIKRKTISRIKSKTIEIKKDKQHTKIGRILKPKNKHQ